MATYLAEQPVQAPPGFMELGLGLHSRLRYVAGGREIRLFIEQIHHGDGDAPLWQLLPRSRLPFPGPGMSVYRVEYAATQPRPIDALSSPGRPLRGGRVEQEQAFAGSSAVGRGHPENPQLERDAVRLRGPGRQCDDSPQCARAQ